MVHYNFISRLFNYDDIQVKIISTAAALSSLFVSFSTNFLGVSAFIFSLLFIVMITDYITGLAASRVEEKRKAIEEQRPMRDVFNSKKGLGWVFKFGSYVIFLSLSWALSEYIALNKLDFLVYLFKVAHFYILLHIFYWEMVSVDENFRRIGWEFQIFGLVNKIFGSIQSSMTNVVHPKDPEKDKK